MATHLGTGSKTPKKIAVLGGGISALTTVFELTSQPNWQDNFDITVYQMGWRLGGKCATARGPNDRIEEHGIHGFLGCYYNALPLMARAYEALGRPSTAPLATFEQAFHPGSFVLMWEYVNGGLTRWPFTAPTNDRLPQDPSSLQTIEHWMGSAIEFIEKLYDQQPHSSFSAHGLEHTIGRAVLAQVRHAVSDPLSIGGEVLAVIGKATQWLVHALQNIGQGNTEIRRLCIVMDFILALVRGTIADDIVNKGFDSIDDENFSDWLARHGASPLTIASPMALNTTNLSYQYPQGDTSRTALMAAGTYLHWTLRSFAYMGAFAWLFAAGTGETVIAPIYEVLRKRGVKFAFFHKVESLKLNADQTAIASIQMGVQATMVNADSLSYEPLFEVKGLPSWPGHPHYAQLNEGAALAAQDIDLESWWTPWQPVSTTTLVAGTDFDQIVFGISIAAIPYLCPELLAASPKWQNMVEKVTTVQTQTMQIWMNQTTTELGWDIPFKNPTDCVVGATYLNPIDGQVDFTHLLPWESWPASDAPKSLWYFSGAMDDYEAPPPFSDHGYPARAYARVKAQCIQYLQVAMGPLLPNATTNAISPPGDPMGLDFSLLHNHDPATAGVGTARFNQQFWRANIDPTERYVTSPPGSTAARIKAWETGFANLVITGDWIYTGLNVGSVEGAVMGGRLASYAVSGLPALADIVGYPKS